MKRNTIAILFSFALPSLGIGSNALGNQCFDITNNSGAARSVLHLNFAGTGGTATLEVRLNANGCLAPTVSNPGSPWDITWSSACVDNLEKIQISINSGSSVTFTSGSWDPAGANVALAPGDVVFNPICVPTLSGWGVGVMVLLVLSAATIVLIRRRAPATA